MSMTRPGTLPVLAFAACMLLASVGAAQTQAESATERSRRALALAGDLMSPFCPGRTLADCPSPNAGAWREEIRGWVEDGVPEAEIRRRLEARMPDRDLSPLPRGLLGWAVPLLILLAGLGILLIALRRVTAPAGEAALDPEVEAKLLRELEE